MAAGFVAPLSAARSGQPADRAPLQLEAKIPLGDVAGRIDHLAVDRERQRLFVAELGNDSVGIIDLKNHKLIRRITGLGEPQGVGYVQSTDTLYVANARDGSVRLFQGYDYQPAGRIELGEDADNVRIDPAGRQIFVGYGGGGLAVIDPVNRQKVGEIQLKGHPESFQLDRLSQRIFVNVPDAGAIAVVDRAKGRETASWPTLGARSNFPMTIDENSSQVLVVFRHPAKLSAFSMRDGALVWSAPVCNDSDDLFVDAKRQRVYLSCGQGFLDVFERGSSAFRRIAQLATVAGARTSLFIPELDRLAVAIRATRDEPAAIWIYRPRP